MTLVPKFIIKNVLKWPKFLREIGVALNALKKCPKSVKQEAE